MAGPTAVTPWKHPLSRNTVVILITRKRVARLEDEALADLRQTADATRQQVKRSHATKDTQSQTVVPEPCNLSPVMRPRHGPAPLVAEGGNSEPCAGGWLMSIWWSDRKAIWISVLVNPPDARDQALARRVALPLALDAAVARARRNHAKAARPVGLPVLGIQPPKIWQRRARNSRPPPLVKQP